MKDNKNNNVNNVPSVHNGCRLAETGWNDYDDFDNPLRPFKIISEEQKDKVLQKKETPCNGYDGPYVDTKLELLNEFTDPSSVRAENHMDLILSPGVHFMTLFKEKGVNIEKAWVFMNEEIVEELRKFHYKHHLETVAYGEFFRLENNDTFSLQEVEYFKGWRVLMKWGIDGKEFVRTETPEFIIQLKM